MESELRRGLNAFDPRPDPLYLIISDIINGRSREQTSYLLVQGDNMIIHQQTLMRAHGSA
jgi:hypothetical protein